jgi:hypothetical protein
VFGTPSTPSNGELTERIRYITANWQANGTDGHYAPSWGVQPEARLWRAEENGEICSRVLHPPVLWRHVTELSISLCALTMPTFTEATREKEGNALLEYAWKVRWPL